MTDNASGSDSSAGIDVASGVLVLDDATQIIGGGSGTLTVDSGGQLEIINGTGAHTGATLDGVIVDDNSSVTNGGIDVASGVLTLTDGTQIQGGNTGTLDIVGELKIIKGTGTGSHTGATLDGLSVTDSNGIEGIDVASGVLTLNDGTVISGGTLTVDPTGQLKITKPSAATLRPGPGRRWTASR